MSPALAGGGGGADQAGGAVGALVGKEHRRQQRQQVDRHQADGQPLAQRAEQGRHQAGAHVGARHLQADQGLGAGRAKAGRGGVDDAGVDGGAAQAHQHQARLHGGRRGQQQGRRPRQDDPLAQADHTHVAQRPGQEAAGRAPRRDADVEQRRQGRRAPGGQAAVQHQVAAGPQAGRLLQRAVAEKAQHRAFGPGDAGRLPQAEGLVGAAAGLVLGGGGRALPQRQAEQQHRRQAQLEDGNVPVARLPALAPAQGKADEVGAHQGAHPPHAVQPAHVAAGVVQGHVVVQGRVHAAGPQPVGHRPQAEHPELGRDRKAQQRQRRQGHAAGRDPPGAKAAGQPVAVQAGDDGAHRDDHREHPRKGHRHPEGPVHRGPGRPQQRIGQAQADERKVDDGKQ